MSTSADQSNGKIALCLSGGGYRAALFHLGTLRCLHDMGILDRVTTVSSVSGGSILAGYIARRMFEEGITSGIRFGDWETDVAARFRRFVRNDIRTVPFLAHVLWNWIAPKWRAKHLQRNYSRKLLSVMRDRGRSELFLSEIPERPFFVFCATDITFGVNWIFTRPEIGDYQVGYARSKDLPLSTAVAASSCFPPIFGPMVMRLDPTDFKKGSYKESDRDQLIQHLNLTDGGVYDNLGVEPVDRGYDVLILSDGGSPFQYVRKHGLIGRLLRYNSVIMRQVGALRKRIFHADISRGSRRGIYVGIDSPVGSRQEDSPFLGYVSGEVRRSIATIRTDLDRFEEAEAQILENHGYFEMYNRVKAHLGSLISNEQFSPATPHPEWEDETRVLKALEKSSGRFDLDRLGRTLLRKE